jgi:hypothetical protein
MLAIRISMISVLVVFVMTGEARADFDPGAGSMLLQALAAGLIGVIVLWRRIKDMFRKILRRETKDHEG